MEQKRGIDIAARPRPTVFASLAMVLLAAAGLWASALIAAAAVPFSGIGQDAVMSAVYYLPFILGPIALYMRRRRGLSEGMRLNPMPVLPVLAVIALAMLSVLAATEVDYLWVRLLNALGLREPQAALSVTTHQSLMLGILLSAALPAICEELLFRGFVLSAWEGRGTLPAAAISTALFALLHGNLFGLPAYLLVGGVSAFLVFALDSLYAGMIYHTVYNAMILLVVHVAGSAANADAAPSAAPGMFSMFVEACVLLAIMGMLLATLNARRRRQGIEPAPCARTPLRPRERVLLAIVLMALLATIGIVQWLGGGA